MNHSADTISGKAIRHRLLATASAFVLTGYLASAGAAHAEDADRPQIWIEAGGQFAQMSDAWEPFAPRFDAKINTSIFPSPLEAQRPPLSAIDAGGKITFQPADSDWVFSAAMRFGRSSSKRGIEAHTNPPSAIDIQSLPSIGIVQTYKHAPLGEQFVNALARNEEHHKLIDFQAGKDVGLGLFGGGGTSVVSAGVRYAQFTSSSQATIGADPDFHFSYKYVRGIPPYFPSLYLKIPQQHWHDYAAHETISRSFRGIGPSLSWEGSVPFAGQKDTSELSFDWGINAALLFGRQRVRGHHDTQANGRTAFNTHPTLPYPHRYYHPSRSKSVTVPNVGGFAGLSYCYPNAKISVGYRADFFFSAIDGGIDTAKNENRGFYGPFASISVGIGD